MRKRRRSHPFTLLGSTFLVRVQVRFELRSSGFAVRGSRFGVLVRGSRSGFGSIYSSVRGPRRQGSSSHQASTRRSRRVARRTRRDRSNAGQPFTESAWDDGGAAAGTVIRYGPDRCRRVRRVCPSCPSCLLLRLRPRRRGSSRHVRHRHDAHEVWHDAATESVHAGHSQDRFGRTVERRSAGSSDSDIHR